MDDGFGFWRRPLRTFVLVSSVRYDSEVLDGLTAWWWWLCAGAAVLYYTDCGCKVLLGSGRDGGSSSGWWWWRKTSAQSPPPCCSHTQVLALLVALLQGGAGREKGGCNITLIPVAADERGAGGVDGGSGLCALAKS